MSLQQDGVQGIQGESRGIACSPQLPPKSPTFLTCTATGGVPLPNSAYLAKALSAKTALEYPTATSARSLLAQTSRNGFR
jgi:hypothetical protein